MAQKEITVRKMRRGSVERELWAYEKMRNSRFYDGIEIWKLNDEAISMTRCQPLAPRDHLLKYRYLMVELIQDLHTHGICHNDVQPDHLLWNPKNWLPFLVDFSEATRLPDLGKEPVTSNLWHSPLEFVSGGSPSLLDDFEMVGSLLEVASGVAETNRRRKEPEHPLLSHTKRISLAFQSPLWWVGVPYLASLIWSRSTSLSTSDELPTDVRYLRGIYAPIDEHFARLNVNIDGRPWKKKHRTALQTFLYFHKEKPEPDREGEKLFDGLYDVGRQEGAKHICDFEQDIRMEEKLTQVVGRLVIVESCENVDDLRDIGRRLLRLLPYKARPLTVIGLVSHFFLVCRRVVRGEDRELSKRRRLVDRCRKGLFGKDGKYYQTVENIVDFAEQCVAVGQPHLCMLALTGRLTLVFDKKYPVLFTGPPTPYEEPTLESADSTQRAEAAQWDKSALDAHFKMEQIRRAASEENFLKNSHSFEDNDDDIPDYKPPADFDRNLQRRFEREFANQGDLDGTESQRLFPRKGSADSPPERFVTVNDMSRFLSMEESIAASEDVRLLENRVKQHDEGGVLGRRNSHDSQTSVEEIVRMPPEQGASLVSHLSEFITTVVGASHMMVDQMEAQEKMAMTQAELEAMARGTKRFEEIE